jgi:hypothetical protein
MTAAAIVASHKLAVMVNARVPSVNVNYVTSNSSGDVSTREEPNE